jgi:hypothetical protein
VSVGGRDANAAPVETLSRHGLGRPIAQAAAGRRKPPQRVLGKARSGTGARIAGRIPQERLHMDAKQLQQHIDQAWDGDIVPQLVDYIRIPNKSPMFDADWVMNGHMERAVQQLAGWARTRPIPGLKL